MGFCVVLILYILPMGSLSFSSETLALKWSGASCSTGRGMTGIMWRHCGQHSRGREHFPWWHDFGVLCHLHRLSIQVWDITHGRGTVIVFPQPIRHKSGSGAHGCFRYNLILPTVALMWRYHFFRDNRDAQYCFQAAWGSGLGVNGFSFHCKLKL